MHRPYLRILLCLCTLGTALSAYGQNARFSGQVTDPQGAAIPGAAVELTNKDGGTKSQAETDGEGNYTIPYLPAGHYKVIVSAPNFGNSENDDVALAVGQALTYNVQLTVGSAAVENVQVTESSGVTQLQTDSAEINGTITGKEVTALQLNGRNFTQFIALVPGVSNQTGQDEAKVGVLGSVAYSVNGGRTEYNSFQVDGSETLNVGINRDHSTLVVYPSIDAIQEIKVLTSNYGAQYPSTGNGTTLVTTKSGGDTFHGSGYEFLRNEHFNSKGYFDVGNSAPIYRRNDFGGTIGGPVVIPHLYDGKGKTHFFYSEEWRFEKSPTVAQGENGAYRQAVPSLAERNGDFSDVCGTVGNLTYSQFRSKFPDCPVTGITNTGGPVVLSNLQSGSMALNANAVSILNSGIIPAPNASSGCNSTIGSCYNADVVLPTYWREELFRIDHQINAKTQASFRFIHDDWNTTVPVPQWAYVTNTLPTIQNYFTGPGISLVARVTNSFSSTLLNEFVASYTNSTITLSDTPAAGVSLARPAQLTGGCYTQTTVIGQQSSPPIEIGQCGLATLFNNGSTKIPGIVIAGNNAAYGGNGFAVDTGYAPWQHANPVYSFIDNVTKILGRHSLGFGAQWYIFQRNQTNAPIGATTGDTQGLLTFSNAQYAGPTGNAFADFLYHTDSNAGTNYPSTVDPTTFKDGISTFQQDSGQARYHQRYQIFEPYIQDDFKVSPRLTINAGLRLSLFGLYHEANKNAYNWVQGDYSPALASTAAFGFGGALVDSKTGKALTLNPADPSQNIDPRLINGIVRCGVGSVPDGCMTNHLVNPSPRVGFAWDPLGDSKMVLRGGYGIFFEHGTSDEANTGSLEGSAPVVVSSIQYQPPSWSTIGQLQDGTPAVYPLNFTAIPTKAHWTYIQQWSGSVERELPLNMLATFGYIGSKGTHLTIERQLNQLQPTPTAQNPFGAHDDPFLASDCNITNDTFHLANGATVGRNQPAFTNLLIACSGTPGSGIVTNPNTVRQFAPSLGEIYSLENVANSAYNGFQATLRRTQKSLTVGVAYSYSHSIDNASDRSDTTFVNSYNLRANRASSNFDQRHLLHVNYVWSVPPDFLLRALGIFHFADSDPSNQAANSKQDWKDSELTKHLIAGWEVSGITLYETGTPFTVVNGGSANGVAALDNAGVANGVGAGAYPDVIGNAHKYVPRGNFGDSFGPLLLNPGAFGAPRGLTFGDAGRNYLNNPQRVNFDVAILRNFPMPRETNLQFRIEAFNVFNHTQFRIYDPVLGNQAQNTISCYNDSAADGYSASGGNCLSSDSSFLRPVDAHRPRTLQLALKYAF
jgi:hypothetical protein